MNLNQPAITVSNGQLLRAGKQWKFTGVNLEKLFGCWGASEVPSDAQLDAYFKALAPNSVTRVWPYHGASDFPMMDKVVAAAERYGQYLAPCLFDANDGGTQCGSMPPNFGDPSGNLAHIDAFLHRYAPNADPKTANPTNCFAFIECGNEVGGIASIPWYKAVRDKIKSVWSAWLVAAGSQPWYAFGSEDGYAQLVTVAKLDLLTMHAYDVEIPSNWAARTEVIAARLNVSWFAGEIGECCGGGDAGSKAGNADRVKRQADAFLAFPHCAGFLYWSGAIDQSHDSNSTMLITNPKDALWGVAQTYRHAWQGIADPPVAPPNVTPTYHAGALAVADLVFTGTGWNTDGSQAWSGVAGDTVTAYVDGSSAGWHIVEDGHHGDADLLIDDRRLGSLCFYNATRVEDVALMPTPLSPVGRHKVTLKVLGSHTRGTGDVIAVRGLAVGAYPKLTAAQAVSLIKTAVNGVTSDAAKIAATKAALALM